MRVAGQTMGCKCPVERCGDARQGIHQRPVQIENYTRLHALTVSGTSRQGKCLKPDQADQFRVAEVVELIYGGDQGLRFCDVLDFGGLAGI